MSDVAEQVRTVVDRSMWIVLSRSRNDRRQLVADLEYWLHDVGVLGTLWLRLYMDAGFEGFRARRHSALYVRRLMRSMLENIPDGYAYHRDATGRYLIPTEQVASVSEENSERRRSLFAPGRVDDV